MTTRISPVLAAALLLVLPLTAQLDLPSHPGKGEKPAANPARELHPVTPPKGDVAPKGAVAPLELPGGAPPAAAPGATAAPAMPSTPEDLARVVFRELAATHDVRAVD